MTAPVRRANVIARLRSGLCLAGAAAAMLSGCGRQAPTANVLPPLAGSGLMPLSPGSVSSYAYSLKIRRYTTQGALQDSTQHSGALIMQCTGTDSLGPYRCARMRLVQNMGVSLDSASGFYWYAQNDTMLAEVAYTYSSPLGPKQAGVKICGRRFASYDGFRNTLWAGPPGGAKADTTPIMRDPPRVLLAYPLSIGKTWVHFNSAWLSQRTVRARSVILTHGGPQFCWEIATMSDVDGDGSWDSDLVWTDWYNEQGMVKRSLETRGVLTGPGGEDLGRVDWVESWELVR